MLEQPRDRPQSTNRGAILLTSTKSFACQLSVISRLPRSIARSVARATRRRASSAAADRDAGRLDHGVVVERRVREARVDLEDVDAEPPPFDPDRLGEPADGELAGAVLDPAGQSAAGVDRAHGDHRRSRPSASSGRASRQTSAMAKTLISKTRRSTEGSWVSNWPVAPTPALLTTRSSAPRRSSAIEESAAVLVDGQVGRHRDDSLRVGPFTRSPAATPQPVGRAAGQDDGRPRANQCSARAWPSPDEAPVTRLGSHSTIVACHEQPDLESVTMAAFRSREWDSIMNKPDLRAATIYFLTEESSRPPSTCVMAGGASGSEAFASRTRDLPFGRLADDHARLAAVADGGRPRRRPS